MKKLFTILGTFIITALAADDALIAKATENSCGEVCEKSCKTKCCPTPPEAICTESYLPSYYDLQCDAGVYIYGDFLYWFANEDNLSPCMTVSGTTDVVEESPTTTALVVRIMYGLNLEKVNHFDAKWDPGFRAGLGFSFKNNGWDLEVNYTWYQNRKHNTFSVPGFGVPKSNVSWTPLFPNINQLALIDPWINTTIYDLFDKFGPFLFDKVSSQWKLHFNQIDLELGNKFWIRQFTALRFFAGVRGAWFTTTFSNTASSLTEFFTNATTVPANFYLHNTFNDQFKDRLWGVGLLAGIQPEWHFCRNFIFFSTIDGALLWGKFKVQKKENYTSFGVEGRQSIDHHHITTSHFIKMQAVFDINLGLRWEQTWAYRLRTTLDVGWENHIWWDDNHRFKMDGSFPRPAARGTENSPIYIKSQSYEEAQGNLMMGGAFIRFRVDF